MSPLYRGVVKWARTTHLYSTLFALALLLFFAITGFMLNHEDWFKAKSTSGEGTTGAEIKLAGSIPLEWVGDPDPGEDTPPGAKPRPTDKLAIVEYLREKHGAVGRVEADRGGFENSNPEELVIHFKRAGTQCDAFINRKTGELTGFIRKDHAEFFMDLHRGKETSWIWHLIIDAVALLYFVLAITGLIMWWSLKGRGQQGHWVILTGLVMTIAVIVIYELWLANGTG